MKIAFYLGSFNPFHNGHLKVIETAFTRYKVDKVVIVPTMQSPWKHNKILGFYDRVNIIALSIQPLLRNNPLYDVYIDQIERKLEYPYYSCKTLAALRDKYSNNRKNELFFLCGKDTMDDIPKWNNGDKILEEWKFLVVERPEGSISSTEIRKLVKECKDIKPYVYNRVVDMIKRYYYFEV